MSLERNYVDIISIFGDNNENNIFINKKKDNLKYIQLTENIKYYAEDENKLFNTIINSDSFKLIDYKDQSEYINNADFKEEKYETIIKKKYLDFLINTDPFEDEKIIRLNTSVFNKNIHIFQNESTLYEFIRCEGINYLSLLMEYYFQILSHINSNYEFKENEIGEICQKINQKILYNLEFFYKNIILTVEILINIFIK